MQMGCFSLCSVEWRENQCRMVRNGSATEPESDGSPEQPDNVHKSLAG